VLQEGETLLDLEFVTLDTSANSEGERYELDLIDPRYTIDWQITDESRASFTPHPTDPFAFDASGHSAGATQVTFRLLYDGQPELVTKPFTIVVRPSGQTAADSASFMITKGGVWHVVCRDGTLLNDECNLIGPSEFVVGAGEYTSLYSYWLPKATDSCGREDFSTGLRYLAYDVEDPCIATVVNHPVHWGEERVFHIKGLQAGETTVRIYLINRVTQSVIQASPPIPVRITP